MQEDDGHVVQALLRAIFRVGGGLLAQRLKVEETCLAFLRLQDRALRAAGLTRKVRTPGGSGCAAVVPNSDQLDFLKKAVTFDSAFLRDSVGTDAHVLLAPFIGDCKSVGGTQDEDPRAQVAARPLVQQGDGLILADPSSALTALRHFLVSYAIQQGCTEALAEQFGAVTRSAFYWSLAEGGWRRISPRRRLGAIEHSYWSFDSDKVAQVLTSVDDLRNYDPADPHCLREPDCRLIQSHQQAWLKEARRIAPGGVLQLVSWRSCGVSGQLRPSFDAPADVEILAGTDTDLAAIVQEAPSKPLGPWKFAGARRRLRSKCNVVASSILDEFSLYLETGRSFYFGDGEPPTHLAIPPEAGLRVRLKIAESQDLHDAPSWEPEGFVDVRRAWPDVDAPIYAPSTATGRIAFLIEGLPVPVWIVEAESNARRRSSKELSFQFCDLCTYWLWQLSPELKKVLAHRSQSGSGRLLVLVDVGNVAAWDKPTPGRDAGPWMKARMSLDGALNVSFFPAAEGRLSGDDNEGERELVREFLRLLSNGAYNNGQLDRLVDHYSPLGLKKKAHFLSTEWNWELVEGQLPEPRTVDRQDLSRVMDVSGPRTRRRLDATIGPVRTEQRTEVVNAHVSTYLDMLWESLRALSPDSIDDLIAMHESVVWARAHQRLVLPSQIACFGRARSSGEAPGDYALQLMKSDMFLRLLVEVVAKHPPAGNRSLSLEVVDELLAISEEVVSRGMLSDAIHFGLSDSRVSFLPSGRIGTSKDDRYFEAIGEFQGARVDHYEHESARTYANHWREPPKSSEDTSAMLDFDELNEAVASELGFSFEELAHVLFAFVERGAASGQCPTSMPLEDAVGWLQAHLGWRSDKVSRAVHLLALAPEALPSGSRPELRPWRFGNENSYLRRPLILRGNEGEAEIVWGFRHLSRVGPQLEFLIRRGRIKAKSKELRRLVGRLQKARGSLFNKRVAEFFEAQPGVTVRSNVESIAGKRIERNSSEPLGDIDVLVVDRKSQKVAALECKDFGAGRTAAELAGELEKLVSEPRGAMLLHAERVAWLKSNLKETLAWLKLSGPAIGWSVSGLLVVNEPLMGPYVRALPLRVVAYHNLDSLLAS